MPKSFAEISSLAKFPKEFLVVLPEQAETSKE
jgi:hypothetical protein